MKLQFDEIDIKYDLNGYIVVSFCWQGREWFQVRSDITRFENNGSCLLLRGFKGTVEVIISNPI
jgi:hypothetical protein